VPDSAPSQPLAANPQASADPGTTGPDPALELEIKRLLVEALVLEGVRAEDIDSTMPLFREGLGLDSIDVLELAMALHRRYGIKTDASDERNREIFACVRNLAAYVGSARTETGR